MDAKPSAECQRVQQGGRNVAGSARAKSPTGDGKRRGRGPARGANTSAAGKGPGVWPAAAGGGGYFRVRTSSPYKDRGDPVPIAADRPALRPLSRPARYETPDTNGPSAPVNGSGTERAPREKRPLFIFISRCCQRHARLNLCAFTIASFGHGKKMRPSIFNALERAGNVTRANGEQQNRS